jgi:hypothetical protein
VEDTTTRQEEHTMFTTLETSLEAEVRDQRERLAGLVRARRTKFRVPRRRSLKLPAQRRKPVIEQ